MYKYIASIQQVIGIVLLLLLATAGQSIGANLLGIPDAEYNALTDIYNNCNGSNWNNKAGWMTSSTSWYGVTVENGHVVKLDLQWNQMTGTIPVQLGNLTKLQQLELGGNQLTGSIPSALSNLTELRDLSLRDNQLTGSIPSWIGSLTKLERVGLWQNQLTGSLPVEICNLPELQFLSVSNNRLSGLIPAQIGNLNKLTDLYLDNNQFDNSIPHEIGGLTSLRSLIAWNNALTGSIPDEIGNLSNLEHIALGFNQLNGSIPTSICNLSNLNSIGLRNNKLTGQIPEQIGNLTRLAYLELTTNQLKEPLPTSLGNLSLSFLWLGDNQFSGPIPSFISNMTNLIGLGLEKNQFSGPIPATLGNLRNLSNLQLNDNQLNGSIPVRLCNLTNLEVLSLASNELTGTIPPQISNLKKLWTLGLNQNQLTGSIPAEIGSLENLKDLYLFQNHLSGTIPAELGNLKNARWIEIDRNQFTGAIPDDLAKLTTVETVTVDHNGLYTNNPALASFLDSKQPWWAPDWKTTQTVSPSNVHVAGAQGDSVTLNWTPIDYTSGTGYYEVGFSATPGGPYTFLSEYRTLDKTASSITVVALPTSTTLYFVVRTVSLPNFENDNTITSSPLSGEVTATTEMPTAFDKKLADGTFVKIERAMITATWPNEFYVESTNRAFGVCISKPDHSLTSGCVQIEGILSTGDNGERFVDAHKITPLAKIDTDPENIAPVTMTNATIGGGNYYYVNSTGAGQMGITGKTGLNNIGLLVRTCGRVKNVSRLGIKWNFNTDPGWTLNGGWAWGQPTGNLGDFGGSDPTSGYTGTNVIGYNLNGDHEDNIFQPLYATTPAVDCTGQVDTRLRFYRWLGVEDSMWDHASIQASNNGIDWTTVWEHDGGDLIELGWSYQDIDISEIADNQKTVYVRWTMGPTDIWMHYCGWNIDDVQIGELLGGTVTIDDGSGSEVTIIIPQGVTPPEEGSFVGITGISSCIRSGEALLPALRTRNINDITVF